jgi:hypothetical protein
VKKCTQCGQTLNDEVKFCFKCGGSNFEPVSDGSQQPYQQPTYQQPPYQQQPSYQQPVYQQPTYQRAQPSYQPQQAMYDNNEPATIKDYLLYMLQTLIPIWGFIKMIIVAVGGPKYKRSLTNFVRASLIFFAVLIVLYIIIAVLFSSLFYNTFNDLFYYNYF